MKARKLIVLTFLAMLLVVSTMACGGGGKEEATPTPTLAPTPGLTPTPTPATPTALEPEWSRTFGGPRTDAGLSVEQTSDGGFIVVGYTESFGAGEWDVYLIKTNASGDEQWSRTLGGPENHDGVSVQQTSEGGFIIAGTTSSYGAGSDVYLIKTDASGNEEWSRTFGGSSGDWANSMQQTSDGGFIIAGGTESFGAGGGVYLIKTDASGNEEWSRTFGGGRDWAVSVQQTSDGGFIIAGTTSSYGAGGWDVYLIKTDASGNEEWSRTFGGPDNDKGWSVQETSDGGYIIAGMTESFGASNEYVYLIKTGASGNEEWSRTFRGSNDDWGSEVQQTSDGGFIIAGTTDGLGDCDVYLIKTDASGNEEWSRTFGGADNDKGWSVQETSDGGYIIAGMTESFGAGGWDVYLIKVAPED